MKEGFTFFLSWIIEFGEESVLECTWDVKIEMTRKVKVQILTSRLRNIWWTKYSASSDLLRKPDLLTDFRTHEKSYFSRYMAVNPFKFENMSAKPVGNGQKFLDVFKLTLNNSVTG